MINSAKSIRQHLADAAWWNKLEFISSIAVWVFGALFILSICCFRRSVVSTILGAKVLEEVDMIKVVKAATILSFPTIPTRQPLDLPTGFDWGHKEQDVIDEIKDAATKTLSPYQITMLALFVGLPDDLAATGMLTKDLINITDACCVRIIHARWNDAHIELYSFASRTYYDLPVKGSVSFLSSSK